MGTRERRKKGITKHLLLFVSWFSSITPLPETLLSWQWQKTDCCCRDKSLLPRQKPWHGTKENSRTYFYPDRLEKCQQHCKGSLGNDDDDDPRDFLGGLRVKKKDWTKEKDEREMGLGKGNWRGQRSGEGARGEGVETYWYTAKQKHWLTSPRLRGNDHAQQDAAPANIGSLRRPWSSGWVLILSFRPSHSDFFFNIIISNVFFLCLFSVSLLVRLTSWRRKSTVVCF